MFYSAKIQRDTNNNRYAHRWQSYGIFCMADDFCKSFDFQMEKYGVRDISKRRYHREGRMSKSEGMLITLGLTLTLKPASILPIPSKPRLDIKKKQSD